MSDFMFIDDWFYEKYFKGLQQGKRFWTMFLALNLFLQYQGQTIIETGSTRLKDDWGAGMSTLIFGDFLKHYGGKLITVDNDFSVVETSKEITKDYAENIRYEVSDSIEFLRNWEEAKIDLLYLDSFDYPYGELLSHYGADDDLEKAIKKLNSITDEEIEKLYGNTILGSQIHQQRELELALPKMNNNAIVLLDDNDLPGGGKTKLAKRYLAGNGYECLMDSYQSLWIKK